MALEYIASVRRSATRPALGLTAAVQTETFACRSYDPVSERTMESARMLYGSTPTVVTFGRGISNLAAYVQRHNQHVALR
jgi:hypothetical protein